MAFSDVYIRFPKVIQSVRVYCYDLGIDNHREFFVNNLHNVPFELQPVKFDNQFRAVLGYVAFGYYSEFSFEPRLFEPQFVNHEWNLFQPPKGLDEAPNLVRVWMRKGTRSKILFDYSTVGLSAGGALILPSP